MEDGAVLKRLYEDELAGDAFSAAAAILWRLDAVEGSEPTARVYEVCSSHQWLGPLADRSPWKGSGWPDGER